MKRLCLMVALLLLSIAFLSQPTLAAPPTIDSSNLTTRLNERSGGALIIQRNEALGTVRFMEAGALPITAEFAGRGMSAENIARSFMQTYGALFGVTEADLTVRSVKTDEVGMTHVRFNQSLGGIPVFGGEVTVHIQADGAIATVGGSTVSGLAKFSSQVMLPAEKAAEIALLQAAVPNGIITESKIVAYNDALVTGKAAPTVMAYYLKVDSETAPDMARYIIVEAQNGTVLLNYSAIYDARDRRTHNMKRGMLYSQAILTRSESQGAATTAPNCTTADVNSLHDSVGNGYDFFRNRFGRDSYNNQGATINAYACYGNNYRNAFWDGSRLVFGDGFALADDVVAHELSHAVTSHASGLNYSYQSGALNESYSDIFGEAVDLTNGRGTDTKAVKWEIGEDVPNLTTRRNMSNPPRYNHADKVSSPLYYCGSGDNGGVHLNSGVPNKAFTLMVDGGIFNGYHVNSIGIDSALKIQYRTNEFYLGQSSQFIDNYNYLIRSCSDLYGASSPTCQEVRDAVNAVEMNRPVCQ
jgi:bacillolysin